VRIGGRHGHLGLVLSALAIVAPGCSFSDTARSTTQDFFKALSEGDGNKACSLIGPEGARVQVLGAMAQGPRQRAAAEEGSCSEFARALSSRRRELFATVIADPAPSSGGKTVTARFELDPKQPVVPYSVRLNKLNDAWKLVSINSGGPP
jgi:hypothetical protein